MKVRSLVLLLMSIICPVASVNSSPHPSGGVYFKYEAALPYKDYKLSILARGLELDLVKRRSPSRGDKFSSKAGSQTGDKCARYYNGIINIVSDSSRGGVPASDNLDDYIYVLYCGACGSNYIFERLNLSICK